MWGCAIGTVKLPVGTGQQTSVTTRRESLKLVEATILASSHVDPARDQWRFGLSSLICLSPGNGHFQERKRKRSSACATSSPSPCQDAWG